MSGEQLTDDAELEKLQRETFNYFLHETNPANGLVIDKTAADWPASIAATGPALAAYPVGVERGFMERSAVGMSAGMRDHEVRLGGIIAQGVARYGGRRIRSEFDHITGTGYW